MSLRNVETVQANLSVRTATVARFEALKAFVPLVNLPTFAVGLSRLTGPAKGSIIFPDVTGGTPFVGQPGLSYANINRVNIFLPLDPSGQITALPIAEEGIRGKELMEQLVRRSQAVMAAQRYFEAKQVQYRLGVAYAGADLAGDLRRLFRAQAPGEAGARRRGEPGAGRRGPGPGPAVEYREGIRDHPAATWASPCTSAACSCRPRWVRPRSSRTGAFTLRPRLPGHRGPPARPRFPLLARTGRGAGPSAAAGGPADGRRHADRASSRTSGTSSACSGWASSRSAWPSRTRRTEQRRRRPGPDLRDALRPARHRRRPVVAVASGQAGRDALADQPGTLAAGDGRGRRDVVGSLAAGHPRVGAEGGRVPAPDRVPRPRGAPLPGEAGHPPGRLRRGGQPAPGRRRSMDGLVQPPARPAGHPPRHRAPARLYREGGDYRRAACR